MQRRIAGAGKTALFGARVAKGVGEQRLKNIVQNNAKRQNKQRNQVGEWVLSKVLNKKHRLIIG